MKGSLTLTTSLAKHMFSRITVRLAVFPFLVDLGRRQELNPAVSATGRAFEPCPELPPDKPMMRLLAPWAQSAVSCSRYSLRSCSRRSLLACSRSR
jgi:hypothetical protein